MTTDDDIDFPTDDRKSRLSREPKAATPDDFASAMERVEAFWEKHPNGSILPEVETRVIESPTVLPYMVHTVRAYIRKDGASERPDSVAHATRGENDPDAITAQFPQETAETAAISRAIRNLGILATPPKLAAASPAPTAPQTDAQIGRDVLGRREAAGLSQADLAAAMTERGFKWSQATVWSVEKGKRPVRFNEGQHLAELIRFRVEA